MSDMTANKAEAFAALIANHLMSELIPNHTKILCITPTISECHLLRKEMFRYMVRMGHDSFVGYQTSIMDCATSKIVEFKPSFDHSSFKDVFDYMYLAIFNWNSLPADLQKIVDEKIRSYMVVMTTP